MYMLVLIVNLPDNRNPLDMLYTYYFLLDNKIQHHNHRLVVLQFLHYTHIQQDK